MRKSTHPARWAPLLGGDFFLEVRKNYDKDSSSGIGRIRSRDDRRK